MVPLHPLWGCMVLSVGMFRLLEQRSWCIVILIYKYCTFSAKLSCKDGDTWRGESTTVVAFSPLMGNHRSHSLKPCPQNLQVQCQSRGGIRRLCQQHQNPRSRLVLFLMAVSLQVSGSVHAFCTEENITLHQLQSEISCH